MGWLGGCGFQAVTVDRIQDIGVVFLTLENMPSVWNPPPPHPPTHVPLNAETNPSTKGSALLMVNVSTSCVVLVFL